MATHQFKFVVSDVDLSGAQIDEIGRAIAGAGSAALAGFTPVDAIEIQLAPKWWWRGLPRDDLHRALEAYVRDQVLDG
jgi:hypothetical protein